MERFLVQRNEKKITEEMANYCHIEERLNTAITAVLATGLELSDAQLREVVHPQFLMEEADRQAQEEAKAQSKFSMATPTINTKKLKDALKEVGTVISREVRCSNIHLDYYSFKGGRAILQREKLQHDLEEHWSVYATTDEQAEVWQLMEKARDALNALQAFVIAHKGKYELVSCASERDYFVQPLIKIRESPSCEAGKAILCAENLEYIKPENPLRILVKDK